MRGGKRPLPGVGGVPTDLITGSKCTLLRTSGSRELGRVDVTGSRSLQALPGRALLPAPSTRVSWSCIYPDFPEVPPTLGDCEQVACGGRLGEFTATGKLGGEAWQGPVVTTAWPVRHCPTFFPAPLPLPLPWNQLTWYKPCAKANLPS